METRENIYKELVHCKYELMKNYFSNGVVHSAWSESSRSYSVATGHRPKRSDRARATPVCDRTPILRATAPNQVNVGRNTSVDTEIDS